MIEKLFNYNQYFYRGGKKVVYGPLNMTPSTFDNYGLDYCSLLVLQSSPPVLVIGNSTGRLNHCIVVDNSDEKPNTNELELTLVS